MQFEYLFVSYVQERGGKYRFYEKWQDEGIIVDKHNEILPVLNQYGKEGWEFVCWDSGRLLFKRQVKAKQLTGHDQELLDKVLNQKERYKVYVDNDDVYVVDTHLDEDDDNYTESFEDFGCQLIKSIFLHLGVKAELV